MKDPFVKSSQSIKLQESEQPIPLSSSALAEQESAEQPSGVGVQEKGAGTDLKLELSGSSTPWMEIVHAEMGVREGKDDTRIVAYHHATSLKAKSSSVAWCSSFANWVMKQAGIKGTNSAWARDWLSWGQKLSVPRYGCITVFERNAPGGDSHVAFFVRKEGEFIRVIGGNQSNSVCEALYHESTLLGYRWPA